MRPLRTQDGKPNLRTFENYGFLYGLAVGLVVGVVMAGPHFKEWSVLSCLAAISGSGIGLGLVGHVAIAMAYGSAISGFGVAGDIGEQDSHHGYDGSGHGHDRDTSVSGD